MKDMMSSGKAKWISFAYPGANEHTEISNPWESKLEMTDQFKPIETRHGMPMFRKSFTAAKSDSVTIAATALGIFDLYCNGRRVGRIDEDGNEEFLVLVFKVPTGSRDGDAYDGYSMAEDYAIKVREKAEKAEKAKADKEKKIAKDKAMREQKAKAKAEREAAKVESETEGEGE